MTDADKAVELVRRALELLANDERGEADAWCDAAIGFLEWGRCEHKGRDGEMCDSLASQLASSPLHGVALRVCKKHLKVIERMVGLGYLQRCHNCGCLIPIN